MAYHITKPNISITLNIKKSSVTILVMSFASINFVDGTLWGLIVYKTNYKLEYFCVRKNMHQLCECQMTIKKMYTTKYWMTTMTTPHSVNRVKLVASLFCEDLYTTRSELFCVWMWHVTHENQFCWGANIQKLHKNLLSLFWAFPRNLSHLRYSHLILYCCSQGLYTTLVVHTFFCE